MLYNSDLLNEDIYTYNDLDLSFFYSQLMSSLSIPKKYLDPKLDSENKFFGKFINKTTIK